MTIEQSSFISSPKEKKRKEALTFPAAVIRRPTIHQSPDPFEEAGSSTQAQWTSRVIDFGLCDGRTKHLTLNTSAMARSSAGCTITTTILDSFCTIVSSALFAPFDLDAQPRLRSVEVSSLTRYTSLFSYSQHPNTCYGPCDGLSGPLCNLITP